MTTELVRQYFEEQIQTAALHERNAKAVVEASGVNTATAAVRKVRDWESAKSRRRTLQDVAREVFGLRFTAEGREEDDE